MMQWIPLAGRFLKSKRPVLPVAATGVASMEVDSPIPEAAATAEVAETSLTKRKQNISNQQQNDLSES